MEREELVRLITRLAIEELNKLQGIPVGVSARHVHLSREDLYKLFGEGAALHVRNMLMGDEFAAQETVVLIGPKLSTLEKVRVLGPVREKTQVELSKTDCFKLGIDAPVRPSGNISGSAPIIIVGPKGVVKLEEGCIVANRHIHMTPEDAKRYGLKDNDIVKVKVRGEKGGILDNVQIRVSEKFRTEMHIDTDDANAMGIRCGDKVFICH